MATDNGVITAFGELSMAGFSPPREWHGKMSTVVGLWAELMSSIDDTALLNATRAYIRKGSEWWPKPGQLLALAPRNDLTPLIEEPWHPMATALLEAEELMHGDEMSWSLEHRTHMGEAMLLIDGAITQHQRDWVLERYAAHDHDAISAAYKPHYYRKGAFIWPTELVSEAGCQIRLIAMR